MPLDRVEFGKQFGQSRHADHDQSPRPRQLAKASDGATVVVEVLGWDEAFVGASTTVGAYDVPHAYPEFIGEWLNLWSRARNLPFTFEVVNAARTGIDSHSIAAIVRQEVVPIQPDLVVYYEGANQFWPPSAIGYRLGRLYPRPGVVSAHEADGPRVSALALRVRRMVDSWRGGDGSEPVKPIVYYLDPATPKQWIPYLKRGIESWQPAFEAAGFLGGEFDGALAFD